MTNDKNALGRPEVVLVAALAEKNRVIGKDGGLPWHIPEDLKHFKRITVGHPLVMGRKTFESILASFGRPLPKRTNVVVTRSAHHTILRHPNVQAVGSLDEALSAFPEAEQLTIGGGATVYTQTLEQADRLELTLVEGDYEGDTFFPPYEHLIGTTFEKTGEEPHDGFRFVRYERLGRAEQ